eukprot:669039-Karenia_brevis.AAC.1
MSRRRMYHYRREAKGSLGKAHEHTTVGSCSSAFFTKNMFSELSEEEEGDVEVIDDGSINLASE